MDVAGNSGIPDRNKMDVAGNSAIPDCYKISSAVKSAIPDCYKTSNAVNSATDERNKSCAFGVTSFRYMNKLTLFIKITKSNINISTPLILLLLSPIGLTYSHTIKAIGSAIKAIYELYVLE